MAKSIEKTGKGGPGVWGVIGAIVTIIGVVIAVLVYLPVQPPAPPVPPAPPSTPYYIDDFSSRVIYSGPWRSNSGNAGFFDGTQHFTGPYFGAQPKEASAMLSFAGTQIWDYAVVDNHHGNVDIYIDGNYQATVDLYFPQRHGDVLVWTSPMLPRATHTINLVYDGTHNPRSRDSVVTIDAFYVIP